MIFDRIRPFNDLPLLPPPVELETRPVLKKVISATRALAELKGVANLIPDQAILINGIILQEARLSSEIENIVTTSDDLYRAASDKLFQGEPATKEVLRYREALWHGFDSLKSRPLSTNLFVEIVKIIRQVDSGIRRAPGTVIANPAGEVIYTPPEGESVIREKLANLESFMHSENGLDPLVKLAAIHYQFEAIHPFPDGNGRTGRIINILFLVENGLLDLPILYLSHYIIQKKSEYFEDFEPLLRNRNGSNGFCMFLMPLRQPPTRPLKGFPKSALWWKNSKEQSKKKRLTFTPRIL